MIYIICKTLVLLNQLNYLKDNIAERFFRKYNDEEYNAT